MALYKKITVLLTIPVQNYNSYIVIPVYTDTSPTGFITLIFNTWVS